MLVLSPGIALAVRRVSTSVLWGALWAGVLGCGDPTGPRSGVRVISGPEPRDTVMAALMEPYVLELRDSRGGYHTPSFASLKSEPGPEVTVSEQAGGQGSPLKLIPLDPDGRITFWVGLGRIAGQARLSVRAFDVTHTIELTIEPGSPASIVPIPADTALYAGNEYPLRATVTDVWGNPRTDQASFSAGSSNTALNGSLVTATAVGRGYTLARLGSLEDTAWVSVVPRGMLTVYRFSSHFPHQDTAAFHFVDLDGSSQRRIVISNQQASRSVSSSWSPDGSTLVFQDIAHFSGHEDRLYAHSPATGETARLPVNTAVVSQYEPIFSPSGEWIYYTGSTIGLHYSIWRMRPDGSVTEQLTPTEISYLTLPRASPGPDESEFVYGIRDGDDLIRIVDLGTLQVRTLPVTGIAPQWSPISDLIAYTTAAGELRVVRSDGTGERTVSLPSRTYVEGVRWSADGAWLLAVATPSGLLELVDLETGEALPLPFTPRMRAPTWMP